VRPLLSQAEHNLPYEVYSKMFYTANEGPVRTQYKCLVPIYVFPVKKTVISKTEV
jgi:hypothetical protein